MATPTPVEQLPVPTPSPSPPSLASTPALLRQAARDATELVTCELALARRELGEELVQMRRGALWGAIALAFALVFLSMLAFAGVLAGGATPLLALVIAGVLLVSAGVLGAVSYSKLPKPLLGRTRARIQDDLARLKEHTSFGADHSPSTTSDAIGKPGRLTTTAPVERDQAAVPAEQRRSRVHGKSAPGLKGRLASAVSMLKETGAQWSDDNAARLAASLALYTLLSIAPLLVIAISVAGMVFGADAARGQIGRQISTVVGPEAGKAIEGLIANAQNPTSGILSSIVGAVVLLFGASGVFGELQSALNQIWEVKPKPGRGIMGVLRDRFLSFSMVMGVAFLLLVSLLVSAALAGMTGFFQHLLPLPVLWHAVNFAVGLGLATLIFGVMFKVVPDVKIGWRDVWVGGLATAVAFSIGRVALAWYVGRSSTVSPFGAAGSLVALVIWIYYSAQILFLGAEFAQVYAAHQGSRIIPSDNAVPTAS